MPGQVALASCRVHRTAQLVGRVEVVVADRAVRRFPARRLPLVDTGGRSWRQRLSEVAGENRALLDRAAQGGP